MNPIDHLIANGYLVIHREYALDLLSKPAYRELLRAVESSLKKRNGAQLSESETQAMTDYFSKRIDSAPKVCPTCGSPVIHQGGCVECSNPSCGWAACG